MLFNIFFNRHHLDRIVELLKDNGINVVQYNLIGLPSWGIVISKNDPIVVEYILKYGDKN